MQESGPPPLLRSRNLLKLEDNDETINTTTAGNESCCSKVATETKTIHKPPTTTTPNNILKEHTARREGKPLPEEEDGRQLCGGNRPKRCFMYFGTHYDFWFFDLRIDFWAKNIFENTNFWETEKFFYETNLSSSTNISTCLSLRVTGVTALWTTTLPAVWRRCSWRTRWTSSQRTGRYWGGRSNGVEGKRTTTAATTRAWTRVAHGEGEGRQRERSRTRSWKRETFFDIIIIYLLIIKNTIAMHIEHLQSTSSTHARRPQETHNKTTWPGNLI